MLCCSLGPPRINSTSPIDSGSGLIVIDPPAGSGWQWFNLTLCPQPSGACVTEMCYSTDCTVSGLSPGTTYNVTVTYTSTGGFVSPPSAPGTLTTPPLLTLTSTSTTGPTSGTATVDVQPAGSIVEVGEGVEWMGGCRVCRV